MFQKILILTILLGFSICIPAQTEQLTAPVNWERYKISEQNISILLPKLPVLQSWKDDCSEVETRKYAVYAEGVIYGLNVVSKLNNVVKNNCPTRKTFSESNYSNRIKELKNSFQIIEESKSKLNNFIVVKFSIKNANYWIINDYTNKRWFEFWVMGADENEKTVKDFILSLKLGADSQAIEIGNGAERPLGDNNSENKNPKPGNIPLFIGVKPRGYYTDSAKAKQIQGTVTLRITFESNGSIGNIDVLKELSDGMTEQVVKAAKRMIFIPQQIDGKFVPVTKVIQYSFTLY